MFKKLTYVMLMVYMITHNLINVCLAIQDVKNVS